MINLRTRTEFSFRAAYGKIEDIIASQGQFVAITDKGNTFGHVPFYKECKQQGKRPILGVELTFVQDAKLKVKQVSYDVTLIALNQQGLSAIYKLVSKSTKQKYYFNRLDFFELTEIDQQNVAIIIEDNYLEKFIKDRKNAYYGVSPLANYGDFKKNTLPLLAISDNLYTSADERELYEIIMGNGKYEDSVEPRHLLNENEWKESVRFLTLDEKLKALYNVINLVGRIEDFNFIKAELPAPKEKLSLKELCLEGAIRKKLEMTAEYCERLNRELSIIEQKNFENYFFLVHDLVKYAKKEMLVGPGRGSSAGSLVCYLLDITEADPIKHGLLFERFIDINRGGYKLNSQFKKHLIENSI